MTDRLETRPNLQKSAKVGCRIISYHREWMLITFDDLIFKIVQEGHKLVFTKHPSKRGARITNVQNVAQRHCILEEIESLLGKHVIEIFKTQDGQSFTPPFLLLPSNYQ